MTKVAAVLTPFVGSGAEEDEYYPQLANDFALISWKDVTGIEAANIIPATNTYQVEIVCTDPVLEAIEADNTYFVIWSENLS